MIIDTSAILAIFFEESEADSFLDIIREERTRRLSVASYVEAFIRVDRFRKPGLSRRLQDEIRIQKLIIEPVTVHQADLARMALAEYGKGSGHPAQLNYGDSFAYALAKDYNEPLLFKGNDFNKTDVKIARKE